MLGGRGAAGYGRVSGCQVRPVSVVRYTVATCWLALLVVAHTTTPVVALGKDRSLQTAPLPWVSAAAQVRPALTVTARVKIVATVMACAEAAANCSWSGAANTGPDGRKVPPSCAAAQTCLSLIPGPRSLGLPLHKALTRPACTPPSSAIVAAGQGRCAAMKWTPSWEYQYRSAAKSAPRSTCRAPEAVMSPYDRDPVIDSPGTGRSTPAWTRPEYTAAVVLPTVVTRANTRLLAMA